MRLFAIVVIFFSLSSCQSTGPAHAAYDHCVRNGWEFMPEWPDNRSVLLAQPIRPDISDVSVLDHLDGYVHQIQEAWFSGSDNRLLICRYNALADPCDRWAPIVLFTPRDDGWEISHLSNICVSERAYVTLQDDVIARWKQLAVEAAMSPAAWSRLGGERFIDGLFNVDPTQIEYHGLGDGCVVGDGRLFIYGDANCDRIKVIVPTDQRSACASFFIEVIVARESGKVVNLKDSFSTLSHTERIENGCLTRRFDKPVRHKFSMFK